MYDIKACSSSYLVRVYDIKALPHAVFFLHQKLGAAEEWYVADRGQFLDHAIGVFGFERVLAESNWFVNNAKGEAYDLMFILIRQSCERLGATMEQISAVFSGNAARVYGLTL
jgi:predicted TIM-barrel fold metal-dependent hydrolase